MDNKQDSWRGQPKSGGNESSRGSFRGSSERFARRNYDENDGRGRRGRSSFEDRGGSSRGRGRGGSSRGFYESSRFDNRHDSSGRGGRDSSRFDSNRGGRGSSPFDGRRGRGGASASSAPNRRGGRGRSRGGDNSRRYTVFERDWYNQSGCGYQENQMFGDCKIKETVKGEGTLVMIADRDRRSSVVGFIQDIELHGQSDLTVVIDKVLPSGLILLEWIPDIPKVAEDAPLIILDLNGVLVERVPFKDRKHSGKGHLVKRMYCDEFIRFCFQNFNVGVWSCGKRSNMEMELFAPYKNRVLFQWDQEKSTNLWPRTSIVSKEKPLFLKELSKVWETYPKRFSQYNTLLVDNHSEKFERNPIESCVLLPGFPNKQQRYRHHNNSDDSLLDPNGQFVAALKEYAMTAKFTQVPRAPYLTTIQGNLLREKLASVFTSSKVMIRNCPERDVSFYMSHRDIPGPRARPFRLPLLEQLKKAYTSWVVCEKSHGVRHMLLVYPGKSGGSCFLVNRSWTFTYMGESCFSHEEGFSLLDGELVTGETGTGFLVFDVVFLAGEDIGAMESIEERMEAYDAFVKDSHVSEVDSTVQLTPELRLIRKNFLPLSKIGELESAVTSYVYDSVGKVDCDGLVFTPLKFSYYEYTVVKFKPLNELTIDFRVFRDNIHLRKLNSVDMYVFARGANDVQVCSGRIPEDMAKILLASPKELDSFILECAFDTLVGGWVAVKHRTEKVKPNYVTNAWAVLESLAERVTTTKLLSDIGDYISTHPEPETIYEPTKVSEVAAHYNERQRERNVNKQQHNKGLDMAIESLRKVNNWGKAVLINDAGTGRLVYQADDSLHESSVDIQSLDEIPSLLKSSPTKPPARGRTAARDGSFSVLELACGRGGDLNKWKHLGEGLSHFVGVDVSDVALREAASRANDDKFSFINYDMADEALLKDPELERVPSFDLISCQFAFHYVCNQRERCEQFFKLCSRKITKAKGKYDPVLIITTTDPEILLQRKNGFSNRVCSVKFSNPALTPKTVQEADFGLGYTFSLGDAVTECEEYLVPIPAVEEIALQQGFKLVLNQNWASFIQQNCEKNEQLLHQMGVIGRKAAHRKSISADEWQALQIYRVLVFVFSQADEEN